MSFFSKEKIIASENFNRWLAVPAALGVHLSIGQVYAFSVFKLPLTKVLGITQSIEGDWTQGDIGWVFSIAILCLGLTAAFAGKWASNKGERITMLLSALFFGGGFLVSALGIHFHQLWLMYIGYGVLGGIGLGLGYVAPVTMLMRWFPDRPGMATGLAIMGFGGGALVASPLSVGLMKFFSAETTNGVFEAFVAMGVIYTIVIMLASVIVKVPKEGWLPKAMKIDEEAELKAKQKVEFAKASSISSSDAMKRPAFYTLWWVLFLNVTAGIGLIYQASPMVQELFTDKVTVELAAWFVGLLSIGNMVGRFFWSTLSDKLGRPVTFGIFFLLGGALYASLNLVGVNNYMMFMAACVVIISMYGGSFATMPVYLKDIFGMKDLGIIYGRTLTAWSAAGVVGPKMFDIIRKSQLESGASMIEAYQAIIYIICGLMTAGFILNIFAARAIKKDDEEALGVASEVAPESVA